MRTPPAISRLTPFLAVALAAIVPLRAQPAVILVGAGAEAAFRSAGTPIHPMCLNLPLDRSRFDARPLAACADGDATPQRGGDGSWQARSVRTEEDVAYRVLAAKGRRFLIAIDQRAPGASGTNFTSLSWIELGDGQLRLVADLALGDRCQGGLIGARVEARTVRYGVSETPAGIVEHAVRDQQVAPPKGLAQGHTDCGGTLDYRYDLDREEATLESVTLNAQDPAPAAGDARLTSADPRACFAGQAAREIAAGRTRLTPGELAAFGRQVAEQCRSR